MKNRREQVRNDCKKFSNVLMARKRIDIVLKVLEGFVKDSGIKLALDG